MLGGKEKKKKKNAKKVKDAKILLEQIIKSRSNEKSINRHWYFPWEGGREGECKAKVNMWLRLLEELLSRPASDQINLEQENKLAILTTPCMSQLLPRVLPPTLRKQHLGVSWRGRDWMKHCLQLFLAEKELKREHLKIESWLGPRQHCCVIFRMPSASLMVNTILMQVI